MYCNSTECFLGIYDCLEEQGFKGQFEVISYSTLSADPSTIPVPVALMALIMWVYLSILKVWPDPQVEEDETSGLMLKVP